MVEASGGLSPRERAVLAAVCDTLVPSIPRVDDPGAFFATGAAQTGTVGRAEGLIGSVPDPRDRDRLRLLLHVLDSRFLNLLFAGSFASFTAMPHGHGKRYSKATPAPVSRCGATASRR